MKKRLSAAARRRRRRSARLLYAARLATNAPACYIWSPLPPVQPYERVFVWLMLCADAAGGCNADIDAVLSRQLLLWSRTSADDGPLAAGWWSVHFHTGWWPWRRGRNGAG